MPRLPVNFPKLLSPAVLIFSLTACEPSLEPEELLARAEQALEERDSRAAMIDVKAALQQEPDNAAGRAILANVYAWQQNHVAALEEIERAVSLSDDPPPEHLAQLARELAYAGSWERLLDLESQGIFSRAIDQPSVVMDLATAHANAGDPEWAADMVASLPDTASLPPYARYALGRYALLVDSDVERASEVLFALVEDTPEYARAWSLLGDVQQLQRDPFSASASYEKAAALNPYRLSDRLNLISLRIRAGEFEAAEAELEKVARLVPTHPGVNLSRGKLQLQEERYADAVDSFAKVLTAIPGHPESTYLSAAANAAAGNLTTAANQYREFITKQPTHFGANIRLAQLYLQRGNAEAAEEALRKMLDLYGMRTITVSLLAFALGVQGEHAESASLYEDFMASQESVSVDVRRRAAAAAFYAGKGERAVDLLTQALESDEGEALATHAQLTGTLLALGNTEEARAAAERAKATFPRDPDADLLLAQVAMGVGDDDSARQYLDSVLAQDPSNLPANKALAAAALQEGDTRAAASRLEDSLAANPSDLSLLMSLAATKEREQDFEGMRNYLGRAMELHPAALEPRVALARDLINRKQAGEAVATLQPILGNEKAQRDPRIQELLAAGYLTLDRPSSALTAAQELVELTPQSPSALQMLAAAQRGVGDNAGAAASLGRAHDLSPSSPSVALSYADALARLGRMADAAEVLDALPDDAADTPRALLARGRIAMAMGDQALAEERFRSAHEASPVSETVLWLAGSIWAQDRREEAIEILGDWVSTHTDDIAVRADYAGRLLQIDRVAQAADQYEMLIEAVPGNALFLNNYAWILRESDSDRALELAQEAKRIAPENGVVLDTLAMVHLARGEIDLARRENDNALQHLPDSIDVKRHRVEILRAAGMGDEAARLQAELERN